VASRSRADDRHLSSSPALAAQIENIQRRRDPPVPAVRTHHEEEAVGRENAPPSGWTGDPRAYGVRHGGDVSSAAGLIDFGFGELNNLATR
jgi:hypothetical protein